MQLNQEFINHRYNDILIQWVKLNDGIQTIAKLWGKHPFHRLTIVAAMVLFGKAHAVATDAISADIGGHDQYHLFKA